MATLASSLLIDVLVKNLRNTELDTGGIDHRIKTEVSLPTGTAAGKADLVYADQRTLAGTTSEVLDLVGVLSDVFGTTISFAKIKLLIIRNTNIVDGDNLQIGPDATNGWGITDVWVDVSDRSIVPAGRTTSDPGLWFFYDPAGVASAAGATDELFVNNAGANPITYDIILVGTSA